MVAAAAMDAALEADPRAPALQPDFFAALIPERTSEDILAGVVHVRLGGERYTLRVLSIADNREWKATLESNLTYLLDSIDATEDGDLGAILEAFTMATPQLVDALYAYDRGGVLPERAALERVATDTEALLATLGVWSAANPFAAVALNALRGAARLAEAPSSDSSTSTNGRPPATAGRRRTSKPR